MKICFLGDTHFGVRNDSAVFHRYFEKFYNELFEYLEKNEINTIIQFGDLFDRRKYINFVSLAESRRYFFDQLEQRGIELYALIGNHDIFFKNSLEVNSPELLLKDYKNITLLREPTTLTFDGVQIDVIPWICKDNENRIMQYIDSSLSPYCVGHFELNGFQLMKGVQSHDGMDSKFLDKYDQVWSGHYHTQSEIGNVKYLGTPYELFWSDYNDPKGFYIFDTEAKTTEFHQNENKIFSKIFYDDSEKEVKIDPCLYKEKYVKIVVVNKKNPYLFDKMVDELYKESPVDISIIEDFSDITEELSEDIVDQAEDTMTILNKYIDQQAITVDGNKLKTMMRELYVEALSQESIG